MSTLKEGSITISEKGIHQIKLVLDEVINNEECFADILIGGTESCLHCNADLVLSYLKEDE